MHSSGADACPISKITVLRGSYHVPEYSVSQVYLQPLLGTQAIAWHYRDLGTGVETGRPAREPICFLPQA